MPSTDLSDLERKHIADVHEMYLRIHDLRNDVDSAHEKIREIEAWIKEDARASGWFYQNRSTMEEMARSAVWVKSTRAILLWFAGLVGGATLIWQVYSNVTTTNP